MIEQRLAERFREAIVDEPPLGFDPDQVLDRAAQRRRGRLAAVGASAGAVALALAAVAVAASPPGSGDTPAPGASQPPVSTPVAETSEPPAPPGTADELSRKLEAVARQVVADHAPALKDMLGNAHSWTTVSGQRSTGVVMLFGSPGPIVSVGVLHEENGAEQYLERGLPVVSDTTNPDGSRIRVFRYEDVNGEKGIIVRREPANGTAVTVGVADALNVSRETIVAMVNDSRLNF